MVENLVTPTMKNTATVLLLSVFFLTLPLLLGAFEFPSRADAYAGMDGRRSVSAFHHQEITQKNTPANIAIIGMSTLWLGLNAKYIEERVSLLSGGSPAGVFTLGANHPGEDLAYVMLEDLIEQRKVEMVILGQPNRRQEQPHPALHRLWRFDKHFHLTRGLPLMDTFQLYALNVLGAPRQLLSGLRQSMIGDPRKHEAAFNGSRVRKLLWNEDWRLFKEEKIPVVKKVGGDFLYGKGQYEKIEFKEIMSPYQKHFFVKTLELLQQNDIPVLIALVPTFNDHALTRLTSRIPKDVTETYELTFLGIPSQELFEGRTEKEIRKLYYDTNHFNANGNSFFSRTVIPGILEYYENTVLKTKKD